MTTPDKGAFDELLELLADMVNRDCGGPVPPEGWKGRADPFDLAIGGKDSDEGAFVLKVVLGEMLVFMLDYRTGQCISLGSKPVEDCLGEDLNPALRAALATGGGTHDGLPS